jgi:hypothetical protein
MDFDKVFTCLADMRVVDKARFTNRLGQRAS